MGASAGRYGVSIGTGAASGAGMGASFGPVGAVIGGGIGALGGALSTLLSSSDEAKEREKQRQLYLQQQQQSADQDWERRYAAITGISNDPMYVAMGHEAYDPQKSNAEFDAHMPDEPTPNYGALAQSLGSLGSTVGGLSRQADLEGRLGAAKINSSGNPWEAFSEAPEDPMQQLLERSRQAAWNRTGGW